MEKFNDIISGNTTVLVDFYATWCQPCKMMHPILEQVKSTLGDKIRIIKIDIDKNNEIALSYGIQSVPTFMIFKNGTIVYRKSGAMSKTELLGLLEPYI